MHDEGGGGSERKQDVDAATGRFREEQKSQRTYKGTALTFVRG